MQKAHQQFNLQNRVVNPCTIERRLSEPIETKGGLNNRFFG